MSRIPQHECSHSIDCPCCRYYKGAMLDKEDELQALQAEIRANQRQIDHLTAQVDYYKNASPCERR